MHLEYINAYFKTLQTTKRTEHINFLLRRSLDLFQRFRLNEVLKQKSKEHDIDDADRMFNMSEYQPLENDARRFHSQSLGQIRAFWQGIRNSRTSDELQAMLDDISLVVTKTEAFYETLISTFRTHR
jgi:hypothetical protein